MNKEQLEQRTYEIFQGGMHCAESILVAVMERFGEQNGDVSPSAATAFGGGVGRCKEEICGALSGGLIALGLLRGRTKPGESWDDIAAVATKLRERFQDFNGCTRCKDILVAQGPQENMEKCKRLTARTAGILFELLEQPHIAAAPITCGCCAPGEQARTKQSGVA